MAVSSHIYFLFFFSFANLLVGRPPVQKETLELPARRRARRRRTPSPRPPSSLRRPGLCTPVPPPPLLAAQLVCCLSSVVSKFVQRQRSPLNLVPEMHLTPVGRFRD